MAAAATVLRYGPDTEKLETRIRYMRKGMLDVSRLNLTSLPEELPAACREFHCSSVNLHQLPRLHEGLRLLRCTQMRLGRGLPALPSTLEHLTCAYTTIKELPPLPAGLRVLICCGNRHLEALPALPPALESLVCEHNRLNTLPAMPSTLKEFVGEYNTIMACETFPFKRGAAWPQKFIIYGKPPELVGRFDDPPYSELLRVQAHHDEVHRPQKARARCAALKEELMAAAWAPRWGEERLEALAG